MAEVEVTEITLNLFVKFAGEMVIQLLFVTTYMNNLFNKFNEVHLMGCHPPLLVFIFSTVTQVHLVFKTIIRVHLGLLLSTCHQLTNFLLDLVKLSPTCQLHHFHKPWLQSENNEIIKFFNTLKNFQRCPIVDLEQFQQSSTKDVEVAMSSVGLEDENFHSKNNLGLEQDHSENVIVEINEISQV